MATVTELREMARTLDLWNTAMGRIDITNETVSNMDYLYNIFHAEIEMRKSKKKDALRHESHLPDKTFDHSKIAKGLLWQLQRSEQIDFRNTTENFLIVGDCVTGKTSLASEIAGMLCRRWQRSNTSRRRICCLRSETKARGGRRS